MSFLQLFACIRHSQLGAFKYSIETLINRLDGMNWDELYALRTFVCLETDPFQAYSGIVNNDLSHLNSGFVTVRDLTSADRNRLVAAICHRIVVTLPNKSEAPTALDRAIDDTTTAPASERNSTRDVSKIRLYAELTALWRPRICKLVLT